MTTIPPGTTTAIPAGHMLLPIPLVQRMIDIIRSSQPAGELTMGPVLDVIVEVMNIQAQQAQQRQQQNSNAGQATGPPPSNGQQGQRRKGAKT